MTNRLRTLLKAYKPSTAIESVMVQFLLTNEDRSKVASSLDEQLSGIITIGDDFVRYEDEVWSTWMNAQKRVKDSEKICVYVGSQKSNMFLNIFGEVFKTTESAALVIRAKKDQALFLAWNDALQETPSATWEMTSAAESLAEMLRKDFSVQSKTILSISRQVRKVAHRVFPHAPHTPAIYHGLGGDDPSAIRSKQE